MRVTSKQLEQLTRPELDAFAVLLVVEPDDLALAAQRIADDVEHGFEYLHAVLDARFAVIRAGLAMTREVISD